MHVSIYMHRHKELVMHVVNCLYETSTTIKDMYSYFALPSAYTYCALSF